MTTSKTHTRKNRNGIILELLLILFIISVQFRFNILHDIAIDKSAAAFRFKAFNARRDNSTWVEVVLYINICGFLERVDNHTRDFLFRHEQFLHSVG